MMLRLGPTTCGRRFAPEARKIRTLAHGALQLGRDHPAVGGNLLAPRGRTKEWFATVIPKLVIITEIIAPYRIPVLNALAQLEEIQLEVIFLSENDPSLREWRIYKDEIKFDYRRASIVEAASWKVQPADKSRRARGA